MNKTVLAVGISAVMMSVAPAFAMEAETLAIEVETQTHFRALEGLSPSAPMNDSELAAIEGSAPPFLLLPTPQVGLVNAIAAVRVSDVRVIRDIDINIRGVNVAVLSAGRQR